MIFLIVRRSGRPHELALAFNGECYNGKKPDTPESRIRDPYLSTLDITLYFI